MNSDTTIDGSGLAAPREVMGHERRLMIVVIIFSMVFVSVAAFVQTGSTQSFDELTLRQCRSGADAAVTIGPAVVSRMTRDLTSLGGYAFLVSATTLICVYLALDERRICARYLAGVMLSGYLLNVLLKLGFDRPRPDVVPHLTHFSSASFPSGHAMMSAVLLVTLALMLQSISRGSRSSRFAIVVALFLSAMIAATRVFLGVHYLTDVVAGWSLGLAWSSGAWLMACRFDLFATAVEPAD